MHNINVQIGNIWFQKIFIPPPRRELEIPKEWEIRDPGNSGWEGGWMVSLAAFSKCFPGGGYMKVGGSLGSVGML